jgi:hypothetical protein
MHTSRAAYVVCMLRLRCFSRVVIAGAVWISGVFCGGPWVDAMMRCSRLCVTISEMADSSRTAAQASAMAIIKSDFAGVASSTWCAHGRSHERSIRLANARWLGPQPSIRTAGLTCKQQVQCKGRASPAELGRRRLGARRSVK